MDKSCREFNRGSKSVYNFHGMQAHLHVHKNIEITRKNRISTKKKVGVVTITITEHATEKKQTYPAMSGEFISFERSSTAMSGLCSTRS